MPRRKVKIAWLVAASSVLLLLPGAWVQEVKLTALAVFIPVQSFANGMSSILARMFPPAEGDRESFEELRRENAHLKTRVIELSQEAMDLKMRLKNLAEFKDVQTEQEYGVTFADVVIPSDASDWRNSLLIAAGRDDGIREGMPVVWEKHLVGRIAAVGPLTSRVLLVTDPAYRVGAAPLPPLPAESKDRPVPTDRRNVGIIQGISRDTAELNWLVRESDIQEGWLVTTVEDPLHAIPKGLLVGRIMTVAFDKGPFARVTVKPMINYQNLDHVMILRPLKERK